MTTTTRSATTEATGFDQLDPDKTPARDAAHFRRILTARQRITDTEAELREAVRAAREAGDTWTVIAAALGTTRQAAQQRSGNNERSVTQPLPGISSLGRPA